MFSLPLLAALAVVAAVTSFISGIFGMAGGMLLIGFLLLVLPVPVAMVLHGAIQIAANGSRSWLWRRHIRWRLVLRYGVGAACALAVFSFLSFVPPKPVVLMTVGLMPFVALVVPQRVAPNIERPGQALAAGAIGGTFQILAGVTGPLLDMFFVRTGMPRQMNVATKAAAQVLGHIVKVSYFGLLVIHPGGRGVAQLPVVAFAVACAVLGTSLSRHLLEMMSDKQFYYWARRIILALGAVYVAEGVWQMAAP